MAHVVVGSQFGLDMDNLSFANVALGTVTAQTPSVIQIDYGNSVIDEIVGSFAYPSGGITGTVTGFREFYNSEPVAQFVGLNVPAEQFMSWVNQGDTATAVQTMFAGADRFDGSNHPDDLDSYDGADVVYGWGGNDTLSSGAGADIVYGNTENDTITAGDGADTLYGGKDQDSLFGGNDGDVIYGNLAEDYLGGEGGNDILFGGKQNDTLVGGAGDDILYGNMDDDYLTGGAGADHFFFAPGMGNDTISDFSLADGDRIWMPYGTNYTVAASGNAAVITFEGTTITVLGSTALPDGSVWGYL